MSTDVILITLKEHSVRNKSLFRENAIQNDMAQIVDDPFNSLFIRQYRENVGIGVLGAFLESHGHKVKIMNANLQGLSNDYIVEQILSLNPLLVGIGLLYDLHCYNACLVVLELRRRGYKGHITLGGPFATYTYEYFLNAFKGKINSVVRSEGELPLLSLVEALKNNQDWRKVPGLAFVLGNRVVLGAPGKVVNELSQLPMANRTSLAYLHERNVPFKTAAIFSSRGCKALCTYCSAPNLSRLHDAGLWRYRSAKCVTDEMIYLNKTYGTDYFYFCDDNFFGYGPESKMRLREMANRLIDSGIKIRYRAEVRVDARLDKELLLLLKDSGLSDVLLGIESGSQTALKRWLKGTTVKRNILTMKEMDELGFHLEPSMILVDPYTTPQEFKETTEFIETTGAHKMFNPLYLFNQMIIFPGTGMEKKAVQDGTIVIPDPYFEEWNLNDEQGVADFCRTISTRDYVIKDDSIRVMWKALSEAINRIGNFKDDFFPYYMVQKRKMIKSIKDPRARSEAKSEYLGFVKKARNWNHSVSDLAFTLLKISSDWACNSEEKPIEELRVLLHQKIDEGAQKYFGCLLEDFLDEKGSRQEGYSKVGSA